MNMARLNLFILLLASFLLVQGCSKDPEVAKREHLRSGDQYVSEKKFREAIIEYRNVISIDPRAGDVRLKLGDAYVQVAEFSNAFAEYVRAADLLPDNVDAQLKAGELLLLEGKFDDARSRADKALAVDPKNVDAQVLKGNALAGLRDLDGAISQLERAITDDPDRALSYANLGALQQAKGNVELAEKSFIRAIQSDPQSVQAHLALSSFYWSANRREEAERELKATLALDAKNLLANRALAMFYLATGRTAEAEQPLKIIAESTPGSAGLLQLADYYRRVKREHDAKAVLDRVAALPDGFVPARLRQASMAMAANDRASAYRLFDEGLAKEPQNAALIASKSELFLADGKLDEALTTIQGALTSPTDARVHFVHGRIRAARRELNDAVAAYREALKLEPRYLQANIELARLSLTLNKADDALQFAQVASQLAPADPQARLLLTRAHLVKGDAAGAERSLSVLSSTASDVPQIQAEIGLLQFLKGDLVKARAAFERALAKDRTLFTALEGLVVLDLRENKHAAARARIDAAVAAEPRNEALRILAARTYAGMKDSPAAERALKQALEINPNSIQVYGALGQFYAGENRLPEATAEFERLVEKQPNSVVGLTALGVLLQLQGKSDQARPRYEKALQLNPRAAVAANNLAWMYAEQGQQLDMALQHAQAAKAELPTVPEVSDTLGWVYYKKGLGTLAIGPFRESVEKDPGNPIYHYHLGLAYASTGAAPAARESLQKAISLKLPAEHVAEANKALAGLTGK